MLKNMKGMAEHEAMAAAVLMIVTAAIFLALYSETINTAELIDTLSRARIADAYASYILSDSCIVANDSLGQKRWHVLNESMLMKMKGEGKLICVDVPNLLYRINITIYSHDMKSIDDYVYLANVGDDRKFNYSINYSAVTMDGRPVKISIIYLNLTTLGGR